MATLATGQLTLADWSKRISPDGKIDPIAELLSQQNDVLEDVVFVEANQPTSHVVTIRTGLPAVYWRAYNQGVPSSKSTTAQATEPCAMLESRSHIDAKLLQLNNNSAEFRLSEESAFIEAMNQEMTGKIFNGNVGADLKTFSGLATRYSSTTAGNGQNVILAGGTGSDNASIYLVVWGKQTVFCPFPKGSQAGLQSRDLGEESVQDASGNWYQAARSLFQWDAGLVVKDWRYVVRIANIDISDWVGVTGTQASTASSNLIKLMMRAIARIPNFSMGRAAFYTNRSIQEGLMIQALEKSNNALAIQEALSQFGTKMNQLTFMGIPVRQVDQLGIAETLVS
ncbi:major capsid protein [Enterobacter ludwigii]|uniref:major capsid protein n=1 Tax=Enterobacter ludwigii TaxID=299767 RepID=UPI003752935A